MKKKKQSNGWLKGLLPVGLMALFVSMAFVPRLNAATYMVSVDPGTTYQTLDGFGAATAWYTNWVTTHPNKAELYKILFNELGLDIIRFRNTYGSRNGASFAPDEPEIVQQANLSLGHPIKVLISSWTPPSDLKANGTLNGGTLVKENGAFPYSKFADYWYNSLVAYANKGISPDYISIQNEPDYENTGWETCIFKPVEDANYPGYNKALDAVYQRVQSLTNRPKLLGPEACGLDSTLGTYTDNMDLSKVYGICHHLYNGGNGDSPDSFISNMKSYGSRYKGKPIFQTEYDYGTPFTTGNL
ncbi:MAG TPA: hypothetical protein VEC37_11070, partial [Bacillota bacterium]|nr:hypothetical protein [Bacillota bacterium]